MTDIGLSATVDFINAYIILPFTIITFVLLLYFIIFLNKYDSDVIKSKIFLRFNNFKKAFNILAIAAFALIMHVVLIYLHDFVRLDSGQILIIRNLQQLLGLILSILLLLFAYRIFRVMK